MSSLVILLVVLAYIGLLLFISHLAGRCSNNQGFFIGNRSNSWWITTLAMIGAAMSGVTFISVPGSVATDSFSYMQMVVGFTIGQLFVAFILVPIFYSRGIVSLYQYLAGRFDATTQKTGAWCFLVAKVVAAALKIYVVCVVMQLLVFDVYNIPFVVNVATTMLIVWLFTRRGGVRSLIPTDILQTFCLVTAILLTILFLCDARGISMVEGFKQVADSSYSHMWFFDDASSDRYFWKMVVGGALCLIAMTGLDQDMMQRNLSCRTMRDSQINIILTALCQIIVILLFLTLGVMMYQYVDFSGMSMPQRGDDLFAMVAVYGNLPAIVGIAFIVGLLSSTFSAAGSALTSLTTSFTLDIMPESRRRDESMLKALRYRVHTLLAIVIFAVILLFDAINNDGIINLVFTIAGYTYGPILGLFLFGIFSKRRVNSRYIPIIAIISPLMSYVIQELFLRYLSYDIGFELLAYNALFVIFGLLLASYKKERVVE